MFCPRPRPQDRGPVRFSALFFDLAISAVLVINDDDHILFVVHPHDAGTLQFLLDRRASAQWVEVTVLKPRTSQLLMKYQFTNVRVTRLDRFMWYRVFRADYDRLHMMVQNVDEI